MPWSIVHCTALWIEWPGFKPWLAWSQCVVFLHKALYSHNVSLYQVVSTGTGKFYCQGQVTLQWLASHQGRIRTTPSHLQLKKLG